MIRIYSSNAFQHWMAEAFSSFSPSIYRHCTKLGHSYQGIGRHLLGGNVVVNALEFAWTS